MLTLRTGVDAGGFEVASTQLSATTHLHISASSCAPSLSPQQPAGASAASEPAQEARACGVERPEARQPQPSMTLQVDIADLQV